MVNYHRVSLIPLNQRASQIVSYFKNKLLIQEYDTSGIPLCIAPNGKQGIFCVSPDFSWRGWFILDEDVRFELEQHNLETIINSVKEQNVTPT